MKTVAAIIPLLTVVILTCSLFLFHSAVSEPPPLRRWDGQGINSIMDPIQTSVTQQQSDPIQGASSNLHFDERYDEYDMYNYNNYVRPAGPPPSAYYNTQQKGGGGGPLDTISRMGTELIDRFASSFDSNGASDQGCCKFEFNTVVPAGVLILISYFFLFSLTSTAGRRRRSADQQEDDDAYSETANHLSHHDECRSYSHFFC